MVAPLVEVQIDSEKVLVPSSTMALEAIRLCYVVVHVVEVSVADLV